MATTVLVVTTPVTTVGGTDFTDAISKVTISGAANEVAIPATGNTPESVRAGNRKFQCELEYFSNDISLTTELFSVFWTALTTLTGDATLVVVVKFRNAAVSATNPSWTFSICVTAASIGGQVGELSQGSNTFTTTGPPVRAVV